MLKLLAGLALFLLGLVYAGLPPDMLISLGLDFNIETGLLQIIGIALFIAGAILMLLSRRRSKHDLEEISRTIKRRNV